MKFVNRDMSFRSTTSSDGGNGRRLEGIAAVFNTDTQIRSWEGTFNERISKGAFKKTIRENSNPLMQWNHGRDSRVGETPIGVYDTLREDSEGLFVAGDLFDNDVVEPIRQAIEAGAITGMSISMQVMRDEWRDARGKLIKPEQLREMLYADESDEAYRGRLPLQRNIKEIRLGEAGPVGRPAYTTTKVGVRSAEEMAEEERQDVLNTYAKTMHYDETLARSEEESDDGSELQSWLDAEQRYNDELTEWVEAETAYTDAVRSWLDAETEHRKLQESEEPRSAVRKHTLWESEQSPEDAVPAKHTSDRERSRSTTPNQPKEVKVKTLEEMRARLAAIAERQSAIATEFRDAELPEKEDAEWDAIVAERSELEAKVAKIEARNATVIEEARTNRAPTEHGTPKTPAFHADRDLHNWDEIRKSAYSDDNLIERATDNARKIVERSVLPNAQYGKNDEDAEKVRFDRLLREDEDGNGWLAKRFIATGSKDYERAFAKYMMTGAMDALTMEQRGLVERAIAISPLSAGGLAVPIQLDPTLVHLDAAGGLISPIRQLAKTVQLVGRDYTTLEISAISAVRAGEAAPAADQTPAITSAIQNVTKVHTNVVFSMEAEEDWASLRSEVFQLIAEAKAREEAQSFLFGAGTAFTPQGIFTGATQTVQVAGAAGAGTLTFADLQAVQDALPIDYEGNTSWLTSKQTISRLRHIPATAGGSVTYADLQGPNSNTLLDTPVYRVAGAGLGDSKSATANQKFALYGDVRRAYTILDRVGMEIQLIPMVFSANVGAINTPAAVQPTGQRSFYAHWRNYGKVVKPDALRALITK